MTNLCRIPGDNALLFTPDHPVLYLLLAPGYRVNDRIDWRFVEHSPERFLSLNVG
jgi:hypothetical protein